MKKTDVVIIGGGLVGCSTAYYLSKRNVSVTVIERGQLNRGASGQNAGSLHFQLEHRHLNQLDGPDTEIGEYISYLLEAKLFWESLEKELGADLELIQHGGIMVAETESDVSLLRKKYELEKKWGLNTELITGDEARKLAPYLSGNIKGAIHSPSEGHANPRVVTLLYAEKATENGVKFLTETAVTDLERINGEWRVELDHEQVLRTDNVVLATGPGLKNLAEMAGLHVPTYPIPLIMSVTEPVKPIIHHLVQHIGKRLTLKQVRDGNVIIGGGWSSKFLKRKGKMAFDRSPSILSEDLIGNVRVATEVVPMIENIRLLRSWSGVAGFNSDQLSLVGEFPERKRLFTGGGDGSFTYGPIHGKILSELIIDGKTDYPIKSFSPSKFSHLNMFMK